LRRLARPRVEGFGFRGLLVEGRCRCRWLGVAPDRSPWQEVRHRGANDRIAPIGADQQDLNAEGHGLTALGGAANQVHVDQGLTGTKGERPGLPEALDGAATVTRRWSPSSTGGHGRCPTQSHLRRADLAPGSSEPGQVGERTHRPGPAAAFNVLAIVAELSTQT
jgi:hypothetical protein